MFYISKGIFKKQVEGLYQIESKLKMVKQKPFVELKCNDQAGQSGVILP